MARADVQKRRRKVKTSLSQHKACLMLHEGTAQGQSISEKQRRLFGAICSGAPMRRGK